MSSWPLNTGSCHATECHPLPDGGMRCEPVMSHWEHLFIWCAAGVVTLVLLAYLWMELVDWRQRKKTEAMFRRWRMERTDKETLP